MIPTTEEMVVTAVEKTTVTVTTVTTGTVTVDLSTSRRTRQPSLEAEEAKARTTVVENQTHQANGAKVASLPARNVAKPDRLSPKMGRAS